VRGVGAKGEPDAGGGGGVALRYLVYMPQVEEHERAPLDAEVS
jgi:predicted membrane-bound spermidine synthase